jgi:hypothetical protein
MPAVPPTSGAPEARRFRSGVLAGSILLNLALAVGLAWPGVRRAFSGGQEREQGRSGRDSPAGRRAAGTPESPRPSSPRPRSVWSQLESTNLTEFAANLRRVGCPDETVCDILRPVIERDHAVRQEQARFIGDFWASGDRRREQRRRSIDQRAALTEERDRLLSELDCGPREPKDFDTPSTRLVIELLTGFLGRDRQRGLLTLITEAETRRQGWQERIDGAPLPEDLAAIRLERDAFAARLDRLLPGADRDELELRIIVMIKHEAMGRGDRMAGLGLTADELREFCRIGRDGETRVLDELMQFSKLLDDAPAKSGKAETAARLRALLGDERYADWQKQNDPAFQHAEQFDKDFKQPAGTAVQVHQVMELLRAELPALRGAWDTDREAVRQAVQERRVEFRRRLAEILAGVPADRRDGAIDAWVETAIQEAWQQP